MLTPLKTLHRRVLKSLKYRLGMREMDYASRVANETRWFNDNDELQNLPRIFHYWSHKYLGAPKFQPFGITDPEQFFSEYINHDCSAHGFEGIRAQDIMPLLIRNFHFDIFIPFANVIFSFIDRPFGHNPGILRARPLAPESR